MSVAVTRAKSYLKTRHQSVRKAMKALKLDGILLTTAADLGYLSGFTGDDSIGIITEKDFHLVTDFRYREQAEIEAGWLKLHMREGKMSDALAKALLDTKLTRIGFEANFTAFGQMHALEKALKDTNGKGKAPDLVPLEDVMTNIRKVKDDQELDLLRKSVAIAEEAFEAIFDEIKVGETENHLAGLLIMEMRSRGASTSSFEPIVAAGANSSLPHYHPGDVLVKRDQPLLFDWGALHKGYCSDLTRTLMIGRVSPKMKEIYKVVLEAQLKAIEFLRPGVTTRQADQVARDVIDKAGF